MGISQEKLAERADLHRTYVSDVERGARNISLESIVRLAEALEVSTSTLFLNRESNGATKTETRQPPSGHLIEILFVEDNPDDAALTMLALKRANVANKVHLARTGTQALDFLFCTGEFSHRNPKDLPQLILLDLNLPEVEGLDVLQRIKSNPLTKSIPVIVLTTSSRSRDIAESRRLGASSYIVKPVNFQNLSGAISSENLQWAVLKNTSTIRV